jgi:hypothetical protein
VRRARGRTVVVLVAAAAPTFFVYGAGRTFDESIGASVHAVCSGVLITTVFFLAPLVGTALLAGVVFRRTSPRNSTLIAICAAAVLATAVVAIVGDSWMVFNGGPAGGVIVAATCFRRAPRGVMRTVRTFALGALLGAVVAETSISVDEAHFFDDVDSGGASVSYHRARAWPNDSGELVYIAGDGAHATD